jgi:NifU-like protein involved in Fe-S cluster formation
MYTPQVLDHFENPRNSGVLEPADAAVQVENPVCGDVLKLTARVLQGRIGEVRFLAKGCVPAIACGSALTEIVAGKSLDDAASLSEEQLLAKLGRLPEASTHALALAMQALAAMLTDLTRPRAANANRQSD